MVITSGGTKWVESQSYIGCMPKDWADHPDGTSDYLMIYFDFRYDASGNPCSMPGIIGLPEEGAVGLYLISPTPRTTADVCFPIGAYTAFGVRSGLGQEDVEPDQTVGDCTDYDSCDSSNVGSGICIDSVGTVSVTETTP